MAKNGKAPHQAAAARSALQPGAIERDRRTVLGFHYEGGLFVGVTEAGAFRPRGLIIWGATDEATVRMTTIGMKEQVLQSMDGIPAKFFALGLSFEHLQQLIAEGVEPPAWPDWDTIPQGGSVRIMITDGSGQAAGPQNFRLAMWGVSRERVQMHDVERSEPAPAAPPTSPAPTSS